MVAEDTVAAENQSIAAGSEAAGTVASPEKIVNWSMWC